MNILFNPNSNMSSLIILYYVCELLGNLQAAEVTSTPYMEQTTCLNEIELNYWDRFYVRPDLIHRIRESKHVKIGALILDGYERYSNVECF